MVNIAIIEPNILLRIGIRQVLKNLAYDVSFIELDYTELLNESAESQTDLMLLSMPDTFELMIQLVDAAQRGYQPQHIVLLSDKPILPYHFLDISPIVGGYISKCASADVMMASVNLVLAGGTCLAASPVKVCGTCTRTPGRRWYERVTPAIENVASQIQLAQVSAQPQSAACIDEAAPVVRCVPLADASAQLPSTDLIESESTLLNLTPRQYMVLALMARGYPLKKISRELNISLATTKTHVEAIYLRLSVNNRNGAVYSAVSRGASLGWNEPRDIVDTGTEN